MIERRVTNRPNILIFDIKKEIPKNLFFLC